MTGPFDQRGVCATGELGGAAFTMPMPPSVNNVLVNRRGGRGRAKSKKAEQWAAVALTRLKQQKLPLVAGPVMILFGFERAKHMARADADNRVKPALDIIVEAGVIEDDRNVVGCAFSWLPPANGLCHCIVRPVASAAVTFHASPDGASGAWCFDAPQSPMEVA